jgi:hypothetical protein
MLGILSSIGLLNCEETGILGDEMTFSKEEKERARAAETSVAYTAQNLTVINGMQGSQIQQGTADSSQTFVQQPLNVAELADLVSRVRINLDSFNLTEAQRAEVETDLVTLEAQSKSTNPRLPVVKESLRTLRSVLENATGGAIGTALPGILEAIGRMAGI